MSRGLVHLDAVTFVSPGERVRDGEGRWVNMGDPHPVPRALVSHAGSGEAEVQTGDRKTVRVDVVVLAPNETPVEQGWKAEVRGLGAGLNGDFRVVAVKNVRRHLRVLCVREDV